MSDWISGEIVQYRYIGYKVLKLFGIVVIMLVASACSGDGDDTASAQDGGGRDGARDTEWVANELLKQMEALRKENSEMRKQLEKISQRLDELEAGGQAAANGGGDGGADAVRFDEHRALGDESASVAIIEFTDFQCPYCQKHHNETFPKIREKLIETGKVRYAVQDYPLPFHGQAKGAAVAANCAGNQGRYWPMYKALFEREADLGRELYLDKASELELDLDQYRTCLDGDSERKAVNESLVYGQKVGVSGTPKFFIGRIDGDRIVNVTEIGGAQSYGVFESAVEQVTE